MIFETHAHYDDEAFDTDRDEILSNMRNHGIEYVVNIGADIASSKRTVELTKQYPYLYGAVGVHPDEVGELDETKMDWLKKQCALDKIVAIGEIGLDYYWNKQESAVQKHWFERQMDLAREVKLPIIVHSRDAGKDTLDVMKSSKAEDLGGIIHCYGYSKEMAKEFVKMGYFLGVGGVVTFKNGRHLKETVEYIPLEYIVLETDSPYLSPEPFRGKRNSSFNIPYIVKEIAHLKGITEEEVMKVTNQNAKRLFFKEG
ncbi:MAG TPA: TatD family hydrolase [Candidatus Merdenecus merdavium]|nr:TatD family hydrolase [Candidatus Merdenecus merdavium]